YVPSFPAEPEPVPSEAPGAEAHPSRRIPVLIAGVVVVALAAALFWFTRRTPASELDAFWAPLFREHEVIQVCVGQPGRLYRFAGPRRDQLDQAVQQGGSPDIAISPGELVWSAPNFLYMRDAFAAARIAAWIQSKGRPFQLISASRTTYSQLRRNPLVAIGAFDNPWALRVTSDLRFVFDHKTI